MTPAEAARLLAAAAAFDGRDPNSEIAARAWSVALRDVPLDEDAFAAVARFYSQPEPNGQVGGRRWLEPHQLRAVRRKIRDERARSGVLLDDGVPDETPDQFLARRRTMERAAANGQLPIRSIAAAPGIGPGASEIRRLAAGVGRRIPEEAAEQITAANPGLARRRAEHPELGIACPVPTCRALPRRWCVTPSGRRLSYASHPSRLDAWIEANESAVAQ